MATNIRFNDVRSFVGKELRDLVSTIQKLLLGEGTNYSNLPIESSVPLEEVVKERTSGTGQAPKQDTNKEKNSRPKRLGRDKLRLFIIHIAGNLIYLYLT